METKIQAVNSVAARALAEEAYIYGYPLMMLDVTRQVTTNVPRPGEDGAPINQFGNKRSFPDETFTTVVTPNADTLYSFAFLNLSREPMVLSVPEMGSRYYLMQMMDAWTNVFASPGTRTTGNGKGDFAITGPGWNGALPEGVQEIKSPTNIVWIIGRTQTNGKDDYPAVRELQNQYKLAPLGAWGTNYVAPQTVPVDDRIDTKTPPVRQVFTMSAATFFARLNALMSDNPPAASDAPALQRFETIGIAPGNSFYPNGLGPDAARSIEQGARSAQEKIVAAARKPHGKKINGWEFMDSVGRYGTDYLWRALVALVGLGANVPEDAVYPRATTDSDGKPLSGANRYEIRFAAGQLPPVGAFWSISMYNAKHAFVKNPLNRFAIGDRESLKYEEDGSLVLFIQAASPGKGKESNWLPAPRDEFNLVMRLYWPKAEILEHRWHPPQVIHAAVDAKKVA